MKPDMVEWRVIDLLCLVLEAPHHGTVRKELSELLHGIEASAERGVIHNDCPYCRSVLSKLRGEE